MTIDWMLVGKRLRDTRLKRKLTQEQLADKANTSNIYICRIENGTATPSLGMLSSISAALECPVSYLIDGNSVCIYDANAKEINKMLDGCSPYMIKVVSKIIKNIVDFDPL